MVRRLRAHLVAFCAPGITRSNVIFATDDDMVTIPAYGDYQFAVSGVQVEGWHGFPGVSESMQPDVQFQWEPRPTRVHPPHKLAASVPNADRGFKIDRHLVTNAEYLAFVKASNWWPGKVPTANTTTAADGQSTRNFLSHWKATAATTSTTFPPLVPEEGTERQPVRWVSMNDARKFCGFYGKRCGLLWRNFRVVCCCWHLICCFSLFHQATARLRMAICCSRW